MALTVALLFYLLFAIMGVLMIIPSSSVKIIKWRNILAGTQPKITKAAIIYNQVGGTLILFMFLVFFFMAFRFD